MLLADNGFERFGRITYITTLWSGLSLRSRQMLVCLHNHSAPPRCCAFGFSIHFLSVRMLAEHSNTEISQILPVVRLVPITARFDFKSCFSGCWKFEKDGFHTRRMPCNRN